jgi:hypothetical protein
MKKIGFYFLVILLVSCFSCKKKDQRPNTDENSNTTPAALAPFKIKIDGSEYSSTTLTIQHNSGYITIETEVGTGLKVGISIADSINVGTYSINSNSAFKVTHTDDNYATLFTSTSGSVTIVSHDKVNRKISGTYSCLLSRINPASTKVINAAEFNVSYPL